MKLGVATSALALSALILSGPALAADLGSMKDTYDEPLPPIVNWTGFYISGGLGGSYMFTDLEGGAEAYGWQGGLPVVLSNPDYFAEVGAEGNAGAAAFFGTLGAGYDIQMGPKWVLGILGDYDFNSSEDASVRGGGGIGVFDPPIGEGDASVKVTTEMGDTWSIGARLGYLINQRTLVYALGGYSEAEFSLRAALEGNIGIGFNGTSFGPYSVGTGKEWRSGYFVGGGLETMLAENLSAKLEYRYAQYDGGSFETDDTFSTVYNVGGTIFGGASMSDPDVHSIRAALSWRFGNWGR